MGAASMEDIAKEVRSPLLPDRMRQADFFVCDIFDAAPKADMASMEHPVFSIATKPDTNVRRYENGRTFVEITPSVKGLATVHDRDILIFCISQIMAAINEGRKVDQTLRFRAFDLLSATNRGTDGRGYEQLRAAFERLAGTRIETNVTTGNVEVLDGFGLIDRYRIVRETRDGRMQEVEVKLSDWVFNAVSAQEVLTLHRNYFRLRKPLERRLYEIARKHCGSQSTWSIGLDKLKYKCGSNSTDKEFKRLLSKIVDEDQAHQHIPDYALHLEEEKLIFTNRRTMPGPALEEDSIRPLHPDTYEEARREAPGWDVRYLEQEWRQWCAREEIEPKRPEAHYLAFCRGWYEKRGQPT
jgi:plasmid replication initiation protein